VREKNTDRRLTSRAELGESSRVTPSDRSAGRAELNAGQGRHIVAQLGFSKLDGPRDERIDRLSFGIKIFGEILRDSRLRVSTRVNENVQ
jgi:hypothetical protein